MPEELSHYKSRGARALVLLHEKHLRQCAEVWRQAKAADVQLPKTNDENYRSLETLLRHSLDAAGDYMVGICRDLELPDPEIKPAPSVDVIETEAERYLEHVLARWRLPLAEVLDERLEPPPELYTPGMPYWVDAMLEHAVIHPIRHAFQLENLVQPQASSTAWRVSESASK